MRHITRATTWATLLIAVAIVAAACGGSDGAADADGREAVRLGIFEITEGQVFDDISEGFVDGFVEATGLERDQLELIEENAQGDPTLIQSIARRFADGDADLVAVVGTPAVIAQAELITDRPVIAMAMGDPVGAGVAVSLDEPGGNVTGSIDYIDPALLLDEVLRVHPDLGRLGTLHDPSNQNMQVWMEDLRAATAAAGIELVEASVSSSSDVDPAARSLDGRVDAILTGPDALVIEAIGAVGQVARRGQIPLYSVGADVSVEGVVGSLGPDYREVGRLAGLAAADVHRGVAPGDVPFGRPGDLEWTLDEAEVERLALAIPDDLAADTGDA